MKTHHLTRSYMELVQIIKSKPYISKADIYDRLLDRDINISDRSLTRYIKAIDADFSISIKYCRTNKGYFIDETESDSDNNMVKFLDVVTMNDLMSSLYADKKKFEFVQFEDSRQFKGIVNIDSIVNAIVDKKLMAFTHHNYIRKTRKEHTVAPLLLKEHDERWYLIGVSKNENGTYDNQIKTFGLGRIENIKILPTKVGIKRKDYQSQLNQFNNIIGVDRGSNENFKVEEVVLQVNQIQKDYLSSLPLHTSQEIEFVNENTYKVILNLHINNELEMAVLRMGDRVSVLEPQHFKDRIKSIFNKALKNY